MEPTKLLRLVGIGLATVSTSLGIITAKPAKADLWCWSWEKNCTVERRIGTSRNFILGKSRHQTRGNSCRQARTRRDYKFIIKNESSTTMFYRVNGNTYELIPGFYHKLTFPLARGFNSCNVRRYPKPIVRYDGYRRPGYQEIQISLSNNQIYEFVDVDNDYVAFYWR